MTSRFAQLFLLLVLGFSLALLIPELGPAIRELANRPSFVAAPRTPSPQTQAAPQAAAVPKLNLRDPRVRNETKAKITSNVNRIKQLSREFKAVWDRKPPKIEGDVVDVGAFEKDLPPGKVKEYKAKATEAKTFLASLALQSYEPQGLELFKELYRTSDSDFGAAILSAVKMIDWDTSQQHDYSDLKQLLRNIADSRDPNRNEALDELIALHPIDAETLGYVARNWAALTEYEKLTALQGVLAFSDAGFAFLKDKILNDREPAIQEQALAQLVRHDYRGNPKSVREKIAAFFKANPAVKARAKKLYIPEESSLSASGAPRAQADGRAAYLAQANPPSGCTPFRDTLSFSEGLQGSSVTFQTVNTYRLPTALSVDDTSGPGGVPVFVRAARGFNNTTGSPTLTFDVRLVNTSQNLGTSGNSPADGAVAQNDMLLMIAPGEVARCVVTYSGSRGPRMPQPAPLWQPRGKGPICGNRRVEAPEECDPPGVRCVASDGSASVCTNQCTCPPVPPKPSPLPPPPPGPVCGNGVRDPGEDCGEPGLVCSQGDPNQWKCVQCHCELNTVPAPTPPPAGGSDTIPSAPSSPNGGLLRQSPEMNHSSFLAQVNAPIPREPRAVVFEDSQPRSAGHTALELVWPGTPAGSGPSPESAWGELLNCDAVVKTFDGAGRTTVRFEVSPQGWSGELEVPPDADRDLVPDSVEAEEYLFNPATGRLEATDMCNPNTRGVTGGDAMLDPDIDWHWWKRLTSNEPGPVWAQNGQEKNGDGFTRWEESVRGFVLPESPIIQTPDGRAARLALRVSQMRTEDGYGSGEGNNDAIPAVKQLFISDRTHDGAIQSLRGVNRVPGAVAMTRFTGIQPVNVGYDYDAWARLQTVLLPFTATTSVRLGDLMGAVNPHNAKDGGVPFQKAQAGVLFREPVFSEERDILRSALAATLVRDGRGAVNNYRHPDPETPEGTVLGLPILFSSQKVAGSFNNLRFTGFPLNLELYFHMIGIHELNHKAVEGSHPSFTPPLEAVIPFADVPNLLSNGSIRNDVWYIIERRTTAGAFEYFAGMDLKTEVSGAIHPYYEPVPIRVFAIESLAVTIREGNNRITLSEWPSALFVRPADQGRRDSRIVAFALFKFFTSSRAQSLNELIGIIFSVKKFTSGMEIPPPEPVGRGGYAVDQDRSMLNQLSIEERPLDYRMMDPASEYRRP